MKLLSLLIFIVFSLFSSLNAQSVEANNQSISNSRQTILTETVNKVSGSIVGITVTEIRKVQDPFFSPFFNDPFFRQFFGDRSTSREIRSLGSGFIISDDGYILTNDHVAGNATKVVVTLTSGKHIDAQIVGADPISDICLLKIDDKNLPYLKLGNSEDVLIGEWVIALGNPFGLFEVNEQPTVTVGVVSAKNMNLDPVEGRFYMNMIQTDAAINGGNSGGPLVNAIGDVIGMNTIIYSTSGSGSIGLGFAIPINKVKRIIDELKKNKKIDRDFVTGLQVQDIDDEIAKYFKLKSKRGVIVTRVFAKTPAGDAGLLSGDVILRINNYRISNQNSLLGVLQEFRTNDEINLTILREDKELTLPMKLKRKK